MYKDIFMKMRSMMPILSLLTKTYTNLLILCSTKFVYNKKEQQQENTKSTPLNMVIISTHPTCDPHFSSARRKPHTTTSYLKRAEI